MRTPLRVLFESKIKTLIAYNNRFSPSTGKRPYSAKIQNLCAEHFLWIPGYFFTVFRRGTDHSSVSYISLSRVSAPMIRWWGHFASPHPSPVNMSRCPISYKKHTISMEDRVFCW